MDTKKISNQNLLKNILSEYLEKFPTKSLSKNVLEKFPAKSPLKNNLCPVLL
jgi:hypothetical protein